MFAKGYWTTILKINVPSVSGKENENGKAMVLTTIELARP
jgi:hypothetical protein